MSDTMMSLQVNYYQERTIDDAKAARLFGNKLTGPCQPVVIAGNGKPTGILGLWVRSAQMGCEHGLHRCAAKQAHAAPDYRVQIAVPEYRSQWAW